MDRRILNRDVIKYIAAFTMLLNHIANVLLVPGTFACEILKETGYFTAITMIYFLVEGYGYSRSKKKYAIRLAVFGVLSQYPFYLAFSARNEGDFVSMNMLITLLLCFLILWTDEHETVESKRKGRIAALTLLCIFCDWTVMAPLFTILFLQAKKGKRTWFSAYCAAVFGFGIFHFINGCGTMSPGENLFYTGCGMLAVAASGICTQKLYNGRRMEHGKTFSKWFFYLFYPLHLLVLGLAVA